LLGLQPQQFPPLTTNPNPHPPVQRRLPVDQPEVVTPRGDRGRPDAAKLTRDAKELAKIADEVPSLVEQANKGVLFKDLNERLKRIEKLSKQLRRSLSQ
jgi:hypothetical protein